METDDIKQAVQDKLGAAQDNLYRAQRAFAGRDMDEMYGESGETRAQIVEGYQREVKRWESAMLLARKAQP